jgi:hypothetical protein
MSNWGPRYFVPRTLQVPGDNPDVYKKNNRPPGRPINAKHTDDFFSVVPSEATRVPYWALYPMPRPM